MGPIEHIGSTAIPGLAAKPVINIMAGVHTLAASRPAIEATIAAGYCYFPYRPDEEHWFCRPSPQLRTHLDREAYTVAKRPFIERITELALRSG